MVQDDKGKKKYPAPGLTECEAVDALIPAYSLGATDPEERLFVQQHLADCPGAASRLAEYQQMAEAMNYSVPPIIPPAHLKERMLAAISRPNPIRKPALTELGLWLWPRKMPVMGRVVAALLIVLLIGSTLHWNNQVILLRANYDGLVARLDRQTEALLMVSSINLERIVLSSTGQNDQNAPYAVMLCEPQGKIGLLHVENLPASDQYKVSLFQGSQMIDVGIFSVGNDGSAVTIIRTPQRMDSFTTIAITPLLPVTHADTPILQGPLYMSHYFLRVDSTVGE